MASVPSQLIVEVTAHAQSDRLKNAQEICADGTYFPNNLCIFLPDDDGTEVTTNRRDTCDNYLLMTAICWIKYHVTQFIHTLSLKISCSASHCFLYFLHYNHTTGYITPCANELDIHTLL